MNPKTVDKLDLAISVLITVLFLFAYLTWAVWYLLGGWMR